MSRDTLSDVPRSVRLAMSRRSTPSSPACRACFTCAVPTAPGSRSFCSRRVLSRTQAAPAARRCARMSERLFVDAARRLAEAMPPEGAGRLAGMCDRYVSRAPALLHERFVQFGGQPPMQYQAHWRMQFASGLRSISAANRVPGSNGLSVAFNEGHAADPVPLAPRQAHLLVFAVEVRRSSRDERTVHFFESVDVDDGIRRAVDLARDNWNCPTLAANMELCRLSSEGVARPTGRVSDRNCQFALWARSPDPAVPGAKSAGATACSDFCWLRKPTELEADVPAMASSGDEHACYLPSNSNAIS